MVSAPTISVVTVTWNLVAGERSAAIIEAIECVQNQSARGLQHVIWDGASDDGTVELIKSKIAEIEARDDNVPIFFHSEPDNGLYDAMNKAVKASEGEYVIFLNSDDLLADESTLAMAQHYLTEARPSYAYGRTIYINEDGSRFESRRVTTDSVLRTIPFCHNSMLFRRDIFRHYGGHDLEFKLVADYDMMLGLFLAGYKTQPIPEPISIFKRGGISADLNRVGEEVTKVWYKHYGRYINIERYSDADRLQWFKVGQLPLKVSYAIFRHNVARSSVRRAAMKTFFKTFRRRLQPWRKWDNLSG